MSNESDENHPILLTYTYTNYNSIKIATAFNAELPMNIINEELIPDYESGLKEMGKFTMSNLFKMIVYYAEHDAHMPEEWLEKNK